MTEEELTVEFGENGWKQLPDAITRRYRFIPAKVEVDEHHVGVYASKTDAHDKSKASQKPASWKPRIRFARCCGHEWKIRKRGPSLSP